MDNKQRKLEDEIDQVNPKNAIENKLLPRLERTREHYSVEPDVFTIKGKRVLKKPNLKNRPRSNYEDILDEDLLRHYSRYLNDPLDDAKCIRFYYPSVTDEDIKFEIETRDNSARKLKPIIQARQNNDNAEENVKLTNGHANDKKVYFEDDIEYNRNTIKDAINSKPEKNDTVDEDLASEMIVKANLNTENGTNSTENATEN